MTTFDWLALTYPSASTCVPCNSVGVLHWLLYRSRAQRLEWAHDIWTLANAERDELLAALKLAVLCSDEEDMPSGTWLPKARAAIAKVEGD